MRTRIPGFVISYCPSRLDYTAMVGWLLGAHWTHWQKPAQIQRALKNSIVIGAFRMARDHFGIDLDQVGFARIVSDGATNSMLTDLYVAEEYRQRGIGRMLMEAVVEHGAVEPTICVLGARKHLHPFYSDFGFVGVGGDIMIRNPSA